MKKIPLLSLLWLILLTGCSPTETPQNIGTDNKQTEIKQSTFFSPKEKQYQYSRYMEQPKLEDMTNRNALINGFNKERSTEYTLTQDDINTLNQYCFSSEYREGIATITDYEGASRKISKEEIYSGKIVQLTGTRESENLLSLTEEQTSNFKKRGWTIADIQQFTNFYPTNYDIERAEDIARGSEEEWKKVYEKIWWEGKESKRYPFNAILVTNDLLLHVYHKLFDNSLKYYEESIARPTLATLSETLYQQFKNSSSTEKNTDIKKIYEFLTAYRSVPYILLPEINENSIRESFQNDQEYYNNPSGDLTDEQITTLIHTRTKNITETLAEPYKTLIPQIIEKILKAEESGVIDEFLATFGEMFLVQDTIEVYQDYTQFTPRSHYRDSSLLKTYFMATKWLMREKFYFGSPELTKAALILVNSIKPETLNEFNQLSDAIHYLIWQDDDLSINGLLTYSKQNNLTTPEEIFNNLTTQNIEEISSLLPQKLQSTSYKTPGVEMSIDEEEAKQLSDGFVFFGEKFTLDSAIFDLTTAGSAEKEFSYKPNKQTALIVADILENNSIANQLVQLRLKEKHTQDPEAILEGNGFTQISSYNEVRNEAITKISEYLKDSSLIGNVYHTWLQLLGWIILDPTENDPYFKQDPLYQRKNLITYMGSYTELKHDTLLYAKQVYAEMGWGGPDSCDILVETPSLPVPKGYIESDPDFLEQLQKLNNDTYLYFKDQDNSMKYKFEAFATILQQLQKLSIQQQKNEIISDEDFEWMRVMYDQIGDIITPIKMIGNITQKEMRGSIIADIFTSEGGNPLYEAIGRPSLLLLMINDINGPRIVIGPIFTHYEFYKSDEILQSTTRYNDEDRQGKYDTIKENDTIHQKALSILSRQFAQWLKENI